MHRRVVIGLLVVLGLGVGFVTNSTSSPSDSLSITAQAKKTVKVFATKKLAKKAVHVKKGNIYASAKLTKVTHNAKNYKHTTFYRTKQVKVVKTTGKKAVYQYIQTSNGKVKGWIWHGFLKNGKAPKAKAGFDTAKASRDFLAVVNKERQKRHTQPLKMDAKFMRLANQRAVDSGKIQDIQHYNKTGESYFVLESPKFGIATDWLDGECLLETSSINRSAGKAAAESYLYHDADSNWGHRDILVNSESTLVGIGWQVRNGMLYNAINTGAKPAYSTATSGTYKVTVNGVTHVFDTEAAALAFEQTID
ncbi:CAP domain-containing protein [Levilactobacillus parabrevis]|uniref:CAP domain-containing protein n=1 Tax=Levilactobacillus parabrevis TaxID=357278 RepID=UPI0021A94143|nr:CAP domain-containing protein [Levilactobacillus parabrevis]